MTKPRHVLALLGAIGVGLAPAAVAQEPPGPATAEQEAPVEAPVEVTKEKLRAFAQATLAIQEAQARRVAQLDAAQTDAERADILAGAEPELVRIVEETPGITREEYNAISLAAREDADLAAVVDAALIAALD